MSNMTSRGFVVLLAAVVVPSLAPGQERKGPPEYVYRRVALGADEATVAATVKEYAEEGWEVTERTADGLGTFRRRFVPADRLGHEKLLGELQGTWAMTHNETNGARAEIAQRITFTVEGPRFASRVEDKVTQVGTIQYLRRLGDLILVDFLIEGADDTPDRWDTARVIVRLDGRTMKYCAAGNAARRPRAFDTREGDGYQSSIFRRVR